MPQPKQTRQPSPYLSQCYKTWIRSRIERQALFPGCDIETAQRDLQNVEVSQICVGDQGDGVVSGEDSRIKAFASNAKLRAFAQKCGNGRPVALVSDRDADGVVISRSESQTALSLSQLLAILERPRQKNVRAEAAHQPLLASYRQVYVTDLDGESICVLLLTVPVCQRAALKSTIYRHLRSGPYIDIDVDRGGTGFSLSFTLSYAPTRRSHCPRTDTRQFKDGTVLRGYRDVSFLNRNGSDIPIYRYEAQQAFTVAGINSQTWDSYCLDDDYFSAQTDGQRLIETLDSDGEGFDGHNIYKDAATRRLELDDPCQDAYKYFLHVLCSCLEDKVLAESQSTIDRLEDCVTCHEREEEELQHQELRDDRQTPRHLRKSREVRMIIDLSKAELRLVSNCLDEVQRLLFDHGRVFRGTSLAFEMARIKQAQGKLKRQTRELQLITKRCEDLKASLEHQNSIESLGAQRNTQSITQLMLPLLVSAPIFSMQDHVLPFQANTTGFLTLVLLIALLVHLSTNGSVRSYWRQLLHVAKSAIGSEQKLVKSEAFILERDTSPTARPRSERGPWWLPDVRGSLRGPNTDLGHVAIPELVARTASSWWRGLRGPKTDPKCSAVPEPAAWTNSSWWMSWWRGLRGPKMDRRCGTVPQPAVQTHSSWWRNSKGTKTDLRSGAVPEPVAWTNPSWWTSRWRDLRGPRTDPMCDMVPRPITRTHSSWWRIRQNPPTDIEMSFLS